MSTSPAAAQAASVPAGRWYRQLDGYHWLVLVVCTLAWLLDCLTQQIFNLARTPAMADLLATTPGDPAVMLYGGRGTAMLLVGWATGGIFFGILGDRIGRVKTLAIMVLAYSVSTGLCGLAQGPWQYIICCFVTGVGAGGIFPVGCTLVAESLPAGTRPQALGMLQAFSAFGNVSAGLLSLFLIELLSRGVIASQWRWMFCLGVLPSLVTVLAVRKLREPEAWKKAAAAGKADRRSGSLVELFGDPRWRRRAIVGLMLASSGVVGLWGIGVFSNDLTQSFIGAKYDAAAVGEGQARKDLQLVAQLIAAPELLDEVKDRIKPRDLLGDKESDAKLMYAAAVELHAAGKAVTPASVLAALDRPANDRPPQSAAERRRREERLRADPGSDSLKKHRDRIRDRRDTRVAEVAKWAAVTLIMFNVGAFFGMYGFSLVTNRIGRRPAFALAFLAAGLTTTLAFLCMKSRSDLFWMVPLMGAAQLSVFGGYAVYFPELFPTRLRSTGTSFCYNVGRYVAATGPVSIAFLKDHVFVSPGDPVQSFRYAGVAMCSCYLVGMLALLFAPETRGQPLPE